VLFEKAGSPQPMRGSATRARFQVAVGLWQKIRDAVIRPDEPGAAEAEEPPVSSVQYPRVDVDAGGGEESADAEREGEGFR
jgi:hypothetical protein